MPLPDDQTVATYRALLRAHATLTGVLGGELMAGCGLPLAWFEVLAALRAAGGRLRMHDLADAVGLSRSGASRAVDRLEAAGLLARERCEIDRRGAEAVLLPEGRAVLRRATPIHLRGVQRHLGSVLGPDERAALGALLDRVTGEP